MGRYSYPLLGISVWFCVHACGVFAQQTGGDSSLGRAPAGSYRGGLIDPPLPKPRFVLTDTAGESYAFRDKTEGKVTLLFFGYTYCPDECPTHMANVGAALKTLPKGVRDDVRLVFVTTDPMRDNPRRLRQWLDNFDADFVGLTGSQAAVEAAQRVSGVPVAERAARKNAGYGMTHANFVVAYTKDNLAHVLYPGGMSREDWVHDLPLLVREAPWRR